ncbi:TonB-dependent receptor [Croceitalea rosinachiae]|uniref:Carboxypeptidase-like regulatory domain-containing protein n=1 Tax=Croceitalea rosinachiae TaxID=3075596 RepID=A0ABU3AAU7_9FLAO|nr:TonB-dependent receptor [Croceitalea sp. F388]MDT0606662.1 carboxypeptidase-like regulatory domain-containing protein [Croceitalea sp. F388]
MKFKQLLFFTLSCCFTIASFAQDGVLTGTLNDGEFNDVLPFANVLIKGTTTGTTSDFDGKYTLDLEEGTYTIVFSYVGYQTKEITDVIITSGKETIVDVTLNPAANQLDEVVVTTTVSKNTEASVLNLQKRSVALLDGLSIQSIKRTGASDIASAVKNVPGVSVQGGKFVYVRGLGDRYTKSILNGVDVPGLDPDRNTLQLDIFPTNILDNIIVVKSATADQPADFTGGVVDIVTKDFPTKAEYSVSGGVAYNSEMHFNDDYLNYGSSGSQFLGFDNGDRDLPIASNVEIPIPQGATTENLQTVRDLTSRFNPEMAAKRNQSGANFNFGFTAGNQYNLNEDASKRIGYLASVSYRNTTEYFENFIDGQVFRFNNQDKSETELLTDRTQVGDLGTNNVLLTGLAGIALKSEKSKYKLNILHIQNGESNASILNQSNSFINSNSNIRDVLTYVERSITNVLLNGVHTFDETAWTIEWKLSPTRSRIFDKDFRVAPFLINDSDGSLTISPSESGNPTRIWRDLQEINLASKLDITRKHKLFGRDSKFKFGGAYTFKNREFIVDQFNLPTQPQNFANSFGGDPDQILAPENIISVDTGDGTFAERVSGPSDSFDSDITVAAGYISEEFKLSDKINVILGLRAEQFELKYTGSNQNGLVFNDSTILDELDFFPSANLIFDLNEDGNKKIRTSYSRTTARPSFKEASAVQIFDPISSTFFIGNLDVRPTYINNFDLRFESYGEGTNFFAISGFYKTFDDPIELQFFRNATGQIRAVNLSDAIVFGGEIEYRRDLGFIPGLEGWYVNTNVSIIESQQDFGADELDARLDNLRTGQTLDDNRQLQGQSPFLINFGVGYNGRDNGWQGGLFYNVQGETLQIVSQGDIPDVFTEPFHNLKLNLSKEFGKDRNSKISLSFSNILNDKIESFYRPEDAQEQVFSFRDPGQAISLSYSVSF